MNMWTGNEEVMARTYLKFLVWQAP